MMLFYSSHRNNFNLRSMYYLRLSSICNPWGFPLFWVESMIIFFYTGEKLYLMDLGKIIVDVDVLLLAFMII